MAGDVAAPDAAQTAAAVDSGKSSAARRAAAPDMQEYVEKYGEQGARRDASGRLVGYKMPEPRDDAERVRMNEEEYERWAPHRRLSIQHGGEANARIPSTMLLDRATGRREVVPAHMAEAKAKKAGMVEAPRWRGRRMMVADRDNRLWRRVGDDEWEEVR